MREGVSSLNVRARLGPGAGVFNGRRKSGPIVCAADESEQGVMNVENRFLSGVRESNFVSKSGRGRRKAYLTYQQQI